MRTEEDIVWNFSTKNNYEKPYKYILNQFYGFYTMDKIKNELSYESQNYKLFPYK